MTNRKLRIQSFSVFCFDSIKKSNSRSTHYNADALSTRSRAFLQFTIALTSMQVVLKQIGPMGVGRGQKWPTRISTRATANIFFNNQSFCENIPTLTNYRGSLLRCLTLKSRDRWELWYKDFFYKNDLKF